MTPSLEQLEECAKIIRGNLPWQGEDRCGDWLDAANFADLFETLSAGITIRIKPSAYGEVWNGQEFVKPKWADEQKAFAEGKTIQARYTNSSVRVFSEWHDILAPTWSENTNIEYRVKPWTLSRHIPGFRELFEGEEWCGSNWTQEMLPEGSRPLLVDEKVVSGERNDEFYSDYGTSASFWCWVRAICRPALSHEKWRTRRPLPKPSPQPLSAEDVPPHYALRLPAWPEGNWMAIHEVNNAGIRISAGAILLWDRLQKEGWLIKRPGETWQPCSK